MHTTLLRIKAVKARTGLSRSSIYAYIKAGLFVPPVKIGAQAAAWPENEVETLNRARVAELSSSEVRDLVKKLLSSRADVSATRLAHGEDGY